MAKKPKEQTTETLRIIMPETGHVTFCILGVTPLIMHRMSDGDRHNLILPAPRKNRAEREQTEKHRPREEALESIYKTYAANTPTRLVMPGGAFKRSLADAALDLPGPAKAQVARLTDVDQVNIHVWGIPKIKFDIVRLQGPGKPPDARFRGALEEWACQLSFSYIKPMLNQQAVINLNGAAGMIVGVGDGRPQKGALSFGKWKVVNADDPNWLRIVKTQGVVAQDKALANLEPFDDDTARALEWYDAEIKRRRDRPPEEKKAPAKRRRGGNGEGGLHA